MDFIIRTVSGIDKMSAFATLALISCTLLLLVYPDAIPVLTGKMAIASFAASDELPPSPGEDPTPFLIRRNVVELTVPEEMTLRQLLELYRFNKPDQRRQVLEQVGSNATPDTIVRRGQKLKIVLTPIAQGVPGTSPRTATE